MVEEYRSGTALWDAVERHVYLTYQPTESELKSVMDDSICEITESGYTVHVRPPVHLDVEMEIVLVKPDLIGGHDTGSVG